MCHLLASHLLSRPSYIIITDSGVVVVVYVNVVVSVKSFCSVWNDAINVWLAVTKYCEIYTHAVHFDFNTAYDKNSNNSTDHQKQSVALKKQEPFHSFDCVTVE